MKKIYTDGHCEGLNGIGGFFPDAGYTLMKVEGRKEDLIENYKKQKLTNNEAELLALFHAAMFADPGDLILSDSQIAINAANKGYSKEPRFQLIAMAIKFILNAKQLKIQWIPREENPVT